jgi:hypothetical protein
MPQLDANLPTKFIELSLRSIKKLQNTETTLYQPYDTTTENNLTQPSEEITPTFNGQTKLKLNTIPLKPLREETPVTAIDVSSIRIGETNTGIIIAIRAAITWKKQHSNGYQYLRIGPFPFHITEENKGEIYSLFRQYSLDTAPTSHTSAPSLIHMQTHMTTLLEHWLQHNIAQQTQNTLILLDGSLTAGTSDSPTHTITQLLATARNRLNTILAFTKNTRLRLQGHRLTDLIHNAKAPCLLPMDGYPTTASAGTMQFLGNIYVAKLTQGNCSFRLDVDQQLTQAQAVEGVQRLLANDHISESYPETLRLAHIYSTFTANEVLAIQRLLAHAHGIKTVTRPNIRRLLFGPYGKGPEGD